MNIKQLAVTCIVALAGIAPALADENVVTFSPTGPSTHTTEYVASDVSLPGASDFTWEAWVKPSDLTLAENRIMGQTDWSSEGRLIVEIRKGNDSGKVPKLALLYRVNGANKRLVSTTELAADTWYHVAVTRTGSLLTIYVNGVQEASASDYAGPLPPAPFTFANAFSGSLAEVRVWRRVLTAAELAAVRTRRTGGTEKGLVGCWALNNGGTPYNRVTGVASSASIVNDSALVSDLDLSDGVPAPIARWSMDATYVSGNFTYVADLSGNDRPLRLGGGCSLTDDALEGKGLYYDGTKNAYAIYSCPQLGSRTIGFWVNLDMEDGPKYGDGDNNVPTLFNNFAGGTYLQYSQGVENGYGNTRRLNFGSGSPATKVNNVAMNVYLRDNWNYFTLTYDQSDTDDANVKSVAVKLYANGYLLHDYGTLTITGGTAEARSACIGCNGGSGVCPIMGVMDEVEAWDCALSAEQVRRHYMRHHVKPRVDLLARWEMDEAAGSVNSYTVIEDKSGKGNDLAFNVGCSLVDGISGKALKWNGFNNANAYTYSSFLPTVSDWSWSGWVNKSSEYPEDTTTYSGQRLYLWGGYGALSYKPTELWMSYRPHNASKENKPGNIFPSTDLWSHYAMAVHNRAKLDGSGFETYADWYVNGVKAGESTVFDATTLKMPNLSRFFLGCNHASNGNRMFSGAMDSVRVYAGAITEDDVKRLYCQPSYPDAGADFTTTRETGVLRGRLLDTDGKHSAAVTAGTSTWTLVSAPDGVGTDLVASPSSLETSVSLPVEGAYVFRLTVDLDAMQRTDEITVTRIAGSASNTPPTVTTEGEAASELPATLTVSATVSDGDAGDVRVSWRKVSGPGAAYFDDASAASTRVTFTAAGTYVLEVVADDGTDTASARKTVTVGAAAGGTDIDSGLVNYWPLDAVGGAGIGDDLVSGRTLTLDNNAEWDADGYTGYGLRINYESATGWTTADNYPTNMKGDMSASFWVYEDSKESYYATARVGRIMNYCAAIAVQHNKETPATPLQVRMWDSDNKAAVWIFNAPEKSLADRWAHITLTANLGAAASVPGMVQLYVDGVPLTLNHCQYPEGNANKISATYNPSYPGSRFIRARIMWGSERMGYRVFPGVIDEMRVYSRKLSEAEISLLASIGAERNRAPQVAIAVDSTIKAKAKEVCTVDPCLGDDGLPDFAALSGFWTLVSGVQANVVMPVTGNDFLFNKPGRYGLAYEATDGEKTTVSPTLWVEVLPAGLSIIIR